ncbi:MAG: hypothetical protein KJT01_17315 [Gemmatimonadetes bacterium]|nr:hypothetical protein [Gemmatimonadota bacterium]
MRTTRTRRTRMAAVATALALAMTPATPLTAPVATPLATTSIASATIPATIPASVPVSAEIGGGPGLTCLGCIVAGTVAVLELGPVIIISHAVTGGASSVAAGSAIAACVAACWAYFTKED